MAHYLNLTLHMHAADWYIRRYYTQNGDWPRSEHIFKVTHGKGEGFDVQTTIKPGISEIFQLAPREVPWRCCRMTNRSETGAKQLGVRKTSARTLIDLAEFEVPVGGGCVAIRLARAQYFDTGVCKDLRGAMDQIKNVTLIVDECTGTVAIVLHDLGTAKGRIYSKGAR